MAEMLALSNGLLRAGLELKLNQVKRATRSYLRDRTDQATGTFASYAIAAGLFAAAGIFLIAASFVGAAALFRWIEINYGLFWAFGAVGLLLLAIAGLCAGLAASRLRRPSPHFPSLTSRLRVAIKASPFKAGSIKTMPAKPDRIDAARDAATAVLLAPSAPLSANDARPTAQVRPARNNREVQAGMMLAATLLGWAAGRRVRQARRTPG
jgi:Putative Actinobacterial Holin-X, holin superfamily III